MISIHLCDRLWQALITISTSSFIVIKFKSDLTKTNHLDPHQTDLLHSPPPHQHPSKAYTTSFLESRMTSLLG